jgi:hypothetical protein
LQRHVYSRPVAKPKPPISAWIVAQRKLRDPEWKPRELAARLRDRGIRAEEGTVRTWEAGRKPSDDAIAEMERLFGAPAPRDQGPGDLADLVAAVRELVEEVRLSRLAQDRNADVLAELLGRVAAGRPRLEGTTSEGEPRALQGTAQ